MLNTSRIVNYVLFHLKTSIFDLGNRILGCREIMAKFLYALLHLEFVLFGQRAFITVGDEWKPN